MTTMLVEYKLNQVNNFDLSRIDVFYSNYENNIILWNDANMNLKGCGTIHNVYCGTIDAESLKQYRDYLQKSEIHEVLQ